MSSNPVVHQAQDAENYNASAKQKSHAKTARIPSRSCRPRKSCANRLDPRQAGSPSTRFYEIKDILRQNKLVTVCEKPPAPTSANASARARRPS